MPIRTPIGVAVLAITLLQATSAWASDSAPAESLPILRLRVEPNKGIVVGSYRFFLSFTNTTEEAVMITQIDLILPDVIQSVRRDNPNTQWVLKEAVLPGKSRTFVKTLPATKAKWYDPCFLPLTNYREMLTLPGKYPFIARLNYNPKLGDTALQDLQSEAEVFIDCTMASKLWGGVLGSILLGLFIFFYEARKQGIESIRALVAHSAKFFWMIPAGAVSAVTLILILNRFQDIGLPINLQVNDFYGALVLGLFTYKLGDWLYGKLGGAKSGEG